MYAELENIVSMLAIVVLKVPKRDLIMNNFEAIMSLGSRGKGIGHKV